MGTFVFRWPHPADHVYVSGTFDDWGKSEQLEKVGDVFEKEVHLPSADETVFYKFVVDDEWILDHEAPQQDDGHYNVNNVLLPHQIKRDAPAPPQTGTAEDAQTTQQSTSPSLGHRVLATSSAPPGSNSGEGALKEAPTVSAGGEGAPLLSKEQSAANLARWIPHVVPDPNRPVTRTLPQTDGASASFAELPQSESKSDPVPELTPELRPRDNEVPGAFPETPFTEPSAFGVSPLPASGHQDTQSSVTTSKEAYENAGGEGTATGSASILPVLQPGQESLGDSATTSKEDYEKVGEASSNEPEISVNPLPAEGHQDIQSSVTTSKEDYDKVGSTDADQPVSINPIPAEGHSDVQSSVTTSKEDYEKVGGTDADDQQISVNPIPAEGHRDVQSSVTTSKEDYEKAAAFGTAGVALAGAGVYAGSALSKPEDSDRNIIPESSLPLNPEKTDTLDAGPFISSSAGPGTTTADLASQVPLEPKREAQVIDPITPEAPAASRVVEPAPFITSSGPDTTTAALASEVPLEPTKEAQVVPSTVTEPHQLSKQVDSEPFISSVGSDATTAGLASEIPLEPKREAQVVEPTVTENPQSSKETDSTPFVSSIGSESTTAGLASQVPLEPRREAQVVEPAAPAAPEAPEALKEEDSTPFISSSGPGTTTAALAAQIPVEQKRQGVILDDDTASPAVAAEKSAVEEELLQKVPESQATGEPASAAQAQTSYYGLATAVPQPVEESIAQAHASPEAATEASVVAEKSAVEQELQQKVPVEESAGEPAPTLSAATATTAPGVTAPEASSSAAQDLTDGKTANEPVPGTDTSTQADGLTTGEIAGGAVVGGTAAAGAAALASKHEDADAEPTRVGDAQKPSITTEALSGQQPETKALSPTAGIGAASPHPGVSAIAGAALSDGTEAGEEPSAPKLKSPAETSEATATEYAPPRAGGIAPGVSPSAAAALSDGTEDPTISEDPEPVKKSEGTTTTTTTTGLGVAKAEETPRKSTGTRDASPMTRTGGESSTASKSAAPVTPKKAASPATGSTASTPARGTPESSTTGDKKKKRHRLSQMIKKIFD